MGLKSATHTGRRGNSRTSMSRGLAAAHENLGLEPGRGGRRSEILVVVANIQMRTLKAKGERFHVSGTCTWRLSPEVGSSGWKSTLRQRGVACGRWNNVGKGSRQNGSVTGKGLARGAGHGVPVEPVGCRWTARELLSGGGVSSAMPGGGRTRSGPFGGPSGVESRLQN
ncbi:hypothetical protein H6P81_021707 [Aristolochia fimbriata]|uniref:Uncharacterized protein n=1 Tax=Aristolochia fimbriata TaxID=158543 RepID=A0AAV7DQ70_ARIFI|nr:hypothetical protein H6P81_021707 [Aristolochia fimbriata]